MTKSFLFILIAITLCGCQPSTDPAASPTMRTSSTSTPAPEATASPLATVSHDAPTETSSAAKAYGPNFEWVVGRLEYSDLEGGTWTLIYAENPEKEDPHGGKFVLQGEMPESLQSGNMVRVTGSVAEQQMGINMAGTYYQMESISAITP